MLTLFITFSLNAQKWTSEEKAIIKALKEESSAFLDYDIDRLSELHIQDETSIRFAGIDNMIQGWDDIKVLLEGYIERNKANPAKNLRNRKENIIIKVTGNTAWLVCDNIYGNGMNMKDRSWEP